MSKYTTSLRYICESSPDGREDAIQTFSSYDLQNYLTPSQQQTIEDTGNWSKRNLAEKIVRYYYFREIGFETWALFKQMAKIEMELLMEYYLPLIYSRAIEYDPLVNVDFTETYTATQHGENTSNGAEKSTSQGATGSQNKFSDTPNVGLDNIDKGKYLTNVTLNDSHNNLTGEAESTTKGTHTQNQDYTKNIKGNSGVSATAQRMIQQFRDNIIAIDAEIIKKLNPLFMGLY